MVQWLRLCCHCRGHCHLIPGLGTKIPHVKQMTWAKKKKRRADQPQGVWLLAASSCSFHCGGPQPITEQDGGTGPSFVPGFALELPLWVAVYRICLSI